MKINHPLKASLVLVVAAVSIAANGGVASATLLGGKWPNKGAFTLHYGYGGGHRYKGNVWQGAKNWSDTPTRVNMKAWPGAPYKVDIDVVDNWGDDTIWGATVFNPCQTCTYKKITVYLFPKALDKQPDATRTKVATHEFGHSVGLAHPSTSKTSIMNQGKLSYTKPQSYDISELKRRYP